MKLENNKNIFCSVSAGYSSVLMAVKIREWYPDHNIVFGMASTSKEREESLEFMHKCDKHFGLDLNWIEADIKPQRGKGTEFNIVCYEELKRNGEIFETGIKKYGIPSKINKWCNRDLKLNPLRKFANSVFGKNNYSIAVGIRADEMDRVTKEYKTNNIFYPLLDHGITTADRNRFWAGQPIQIEIPAYKGNCDMCFEKSRRKLLTIIQEEPDKSKWWQDMIDKYSKIPIPGKKAYNAFALNRGMRFYRDNMSVRELVELANEQTHLKKATDDYIYEDEFLDSEGDCGSGCKVF